MIKFYENMEKTRENILTSAIIGDALGRSCEGLSRGHLKEHGGMGDDYIDPYPMLKGKMERWTMPGLYSCQAQMILIAAFSSVRGYFDSHEFLRLCAMGSEKGPGDFGIFRNPPFIIRHLINGLPNPLKARPGNAISSSGLIALAAPLALYAPSKKKLILDVIAVSSLLHADPASTASALSFSYFLYGLLNDEHPAPSDAIAAAALANRLIIPEIDGNAPDIFDRGMNAGTLSDELKRMGELLDSLTGCSEHEHGEMIICAGVNRAMKTPVSRATVDHPFTIYPHLLIILSTWKREPEKLLHFCARLGGASTTLTCLAGIISGALYRENICPPSLVNGLVNRKLIFSTVQALAINNLPGDLAADFMSAEAGLTKKEIEEHTAKLKHTKTKNTKTDETRRDRQDRLSKHVVESWTKIDKSRWKKERKNLE